MRNTFPLVEIVFFLAVVSAPQDATDIQVTSPPLSFHWTRTTKGWSGGWLDRATWSTTDKNFVVAHNKASRKEIEPDIDASKPFVVVKGGKEKGVIDVSEFIKQTLGGKWELIKKTDSFAQSSLDKVKDGFVYTAHNGGEARRFIITFPHQSNHVPQPTAGAQGVPAERRPYSRPSDG